MMRKVTVKDVAKAVNADFENAADLEVADVTHDSRQAGNGSRLSHGEAVGCPAKRAWVNRHEGRLRRR